MIVLGEQHKDSDIHIHVSILPQIPLPFRPFLAFLSFKGPTLKGWIPGQGGENQQESKGHQRNIPLDEKLGVPEPPGLLLLTKQWFMLEPRLFLKVKSKGNVCL